LSVSLKSLRKYLDKADDLSSKVVVEYFEEHSLDQLRWRLYYDYKSGAGVGRFMRNIWIEYMDGSNAELIEFYEKTRRKVETPHYENLIIMFLISFLSSLTASILAVEYKEHRKDIPKAVKAFILKSITKFEAIKEELKGFFIRPITYLFRAFALREMYNENHISKQEHDKTLILIKRRELYGEEISIDLGKFERYEKEFLEKHSIVSCGNVLEELLKRYLKRVQC
jgi:hypothetical protein